MKRYVVGFLFSPDLEFVALIEKQRPDWQRGRYNGVGGHIEEGELPAQAMAREFEEEAGLKLDTWREFCVLHGAGFVVHFFEARAENYRDIAPRTDEDVQLWPTRGLPLKMLPNLRWLIPMAMDKDRIAATANEYGS